MEGLEERVQRCTATNQQLSKRVNLLEEHNHSLLDQLHRLQALLATYSPTKLQAGSMLLVLLLSFSILCLPSLRQPSSSHTSGEAP